MAKKSTKKDAQPIEAAAEVGSKNREEAHAEKRQPEQYATTGGRVIDRVKVFNEDGRDFVQAQYGKLNADGKTSEERRAGMEKLSKRPLSHEQLAQYLKMFNEDPVKAKEYLVKEAYPMFLDDKAFSATKGVVGGKDVSYVIFSKIKAEDLKEDQQHLAGRWQVAAGVKDGVRMTALLSREEVAALHHRSEVTLDDKGKVLSYGKPASMLGIADSAISRRIRNEQLLDSAKGIDWGSHKLPQGVEVKGLHWAPSNDGKLWLNAKVNGVELHGVMSDVESTAIRNKLATAEQVLMHNARLSKEVERYASQQDRGMHV